MRPTLEQNLDLQLRALEKAGCKKIFREKVSGDNRDRPQFQRMLDQVRVGDTIVVWKLDRLACSTRDLLETMEAIREAGGIGTGSVEVVKNLAQSRETVLAILRPRDFLGEVSVAF